MADLVIEQVGDFNGFGAVAYLRTIVYVIEQNCPFHEEFDGSDNGAVHYLGRIDGAPVTSCRVFEKETSAKIGRIVTAQEYRGKGYASRLLNFVISELEKKPEHQYIEMSAQDHAIGLYEKLGFEICGDGYTEARIPHHRMRKAIRPKE